MIVLDTHVWVWWVQGDARLGTRAIRELDRRAGDGIGVSVVSCWEVAMLHERGRLAFPCSLDKWIAAALGYPGVKVLDLTPAIAIESCRLPGDFQRDPADRIIVATARLLACPLVTADQKMLRYSNVDALNPVDLTGWA